MKTKIGLKEVAQIDGGKLNVLFNQRLAEVVGDCQNRPGDNTKRKVTLELSCKPAEVASGICQSIELEFRCFASVPKRQTRVYTAIVTGRGDVVMNDLSPDDPHQTTLDEVERDAESSDD